MKPVPHSHKVPIPTPPAAALNKDASSSQYESSSEVSGCEMFREENEPHFQF